MYIKNGIINWSPRLLKTDLLRLYESEAAGLIDEALLEETGLTLFIRCSDILYVYDIQNGLIRCPNCEYREGKRIKMNALNNIYTCPDCAFSMSWEQLTQSYRHKQLNPGGAVQFFREFLYDWDQSKSTTEKILAVDKVIHSFHYSLKANPALPTRSAGVNLIEGKLNDVVDFLDALSAGRNDTVSLLFRQQLAVYRQLWKSEQSE